MLKRIGTVFSSGDPSTETGLDPTLIVFKAFDALGTSVAVPTISELATDGLYYFDATVLANVPIYWVMDGFTTGLGGNRYVSGILDPSQAIDLQTTNQSTTLQALIGSASSAIGDDLTDPTDMFGWLMRNQEWLEGDGSYNKSTGVWTSQNRAGTTTLASKTIADSDTEVTKS